MSMTLEEKLNKWHQLEYWRENDPRFGKGWQELYVIKKLHEESKKQRKKKPKPLSKKERQDYLDQVEANFIFRRDVPYIMLGAIDPGRIKPWFKMLLKAAGIDSSCLHKSNARTVANKDLKRYLNLLKRHLIDDVSISRLAKEWAEANTTDERLRLPTTYETRLHREIIGPLIEDLWRFIHTYLDDILPNSPNRPPDTLPISEKKEILRYYFKKTASFSKTEYQAFYQSTNFRTFEDECIDIYGRYFRTLQNKYITTKLAPTDHT